MISAAVGYQCPECVKAHTKATRQNQGPYGGTVSPNPRVTSIVLMVINACVWGLIQVAGFAGVQDRVVQFLGLLPQGMCSATDVPGSYWPGVGQAACARIPYAQWVPGVADGAWWQIFTSIFTHVTIMHVAMNCLTLWFIGPPLEALLGRARFLTTYLVSGLVGSLSVYWLSSPSSLSYGGSGSLFGVMGALLLLLWRRKADVRQLLMWLGLNIAMTFIDAATISWQAHMGGLIGGVILGCIWVFVPPSANRTRIQVALVLVLVLLIAVGLVLRTPMLA